MLKFRNYLFCATLVTFLIMGCSNKKYIFYSNDFQHETFYIVDFNSLEAKALYYDNKPVEINGYFHVDMENIYIHNKKKKYG